MSSLHDLPDWVGDLVTAAGRSGEDVDAAIELSRVFGGSLPIPAAGSTAQRWAVLSELGRVNLTVARVFEAHTDALAILAENGHANADGRSWGVFAAEAPDTRLDATPSGTGFTVTGTKPWCSLGGRLDAALVTARIPDGGRQLFEVDLHGDGVRPEPAQGWVARGLRTVTSGPVHFDSVPALPVGGPQWYLTRAGFAWGGIGVAACWHGGAVGLLDALVRTARARKRELDALHVGVVDVALHASSVALAAAAAVIDARGAGSPAILALRTRSVVALSVETVLLQVGHALGPAPLAFDAEYAARVADLSLYVRQHHGERDLVSLGAAVLEHDA